MTRSWFGFKRIFTAARPWSTAPAAPPPPPEQVPQRGNTVHKWFLMPMAAVATAVAASALAVPAGAQANGRRRDFTRVVTLAGTTLQINSSVNFGRFLVGTSAIPPAASATLTNLTAP